MPCAHCNSMLILVENRWRCPRCDHLPILDKNTAIEACRRVVTFLDNILKKYLQSFDTDRLALHVLWQREKFARSFFDTYQAFHLTKFMAFNALIKQLMKEKAPTRGIAANATNTENLVNQFTNYISIVGTLISVENGFYSLLFPEGLDPRSASEIEIVNNLKTVPNETYWPVMNTFRNNDILNDKEVETRIQEQKALAEALRKQVLLSGHKVRYTSDQIIENQYFVLNQLYCGLQKNRMFQRTFDLSSFEGLAPHRIMDFVNQFPLVEGVITSARVDDFLGRLQRSFHGIRLRLLERKLIFSKGNADIFPLFVRLRDLIYVSHRTAF